jgi:hypothetical protein
VDPHYGVIEQFFASAAKLFRSVDIPAVIREEPVQEFFPAFHEILV